MYATKLHQIVTKRDVTKNKDNVLFYYVHLYVYINIQDCYYWRLGTDFFGILIIQLFKH